MEGRSPLERVRGPRGERKAVNRIVLIVLLAALLPAGARAADAEDPFADFRIPDHKVFSWTGDVTFSGSWNDMSFPSGGSVENGYQLGGLGTSAYWLRDSDPTLQLMGVRLAASGARLFDESRDAFSFRERRNRRLQESGSLWFSQRRYPWRVPLGIQLSGSALGAYSQDWSKESMVVGIPPSVTTNRIRRRTDRYDYTLTGSAAVGVGRVRDATGVYDVLVLEERLRERGVLAGPLDRATRNRLAELAYARGSFGDVLDRPGKAFWSALVEILESDPSYQGRLDPAAVLEALEPHLGGGGASLFPKSPISRFRGAFAGVVASAFYRHEIARFEVAEFVQVSIGDTMLPPSTFEGSARMDQEQVDVLVGPQAEWHRPIGPRWQIDLSTQALFSRDGFQNGLRLSSTASSRWIVADRWLAGADFFHTRSTLGREDFWYVQLDGQLDWYIEDRLRLRLQVGSRQSHEGAPSNRLQRRHGVSLSLGYRFAGRLEAPGLFEPIRTP